MHSRRHDISLIRSLSWHISWILNEMLSLLLINTLNHHQSNHIKRETPFSWKLTFVKTEIISLSSINIRLDLMKIYMNIDIFTSFITSSITKYMSIQSSLNHSIDFLDIIISHYYQFSYWHFSALNLIFHSFYYFWQIFLYINI